MTTRHHLATGLLIAATCAACAESEPPPHVILIVVDTLRADALGCHGHDAAHTPAIDAFAAESVRFTDAVSSSGWTLPSVSSLLTGVWPSLHKATGKLTLLRPISPDAPTLAELLVDEGYATLGFANAAFLSPLLGLDRGFQVFDHKHAYNQDVRRADQTVSDALLALDTRDTDKPLFLLVHLFDAHLDYDPLPKDLARATAGLTGPAPPLSLRGCKELAADEPPSPELQAWVRAVYDAEVAAIDRAFARLRADLVARGIWDDAVVILTADHGEEFWDHGGFEHGHTLYSELIHVPLIIKAPRSAGIEPRTINAQVRVLDTFPTVFDLCELPLQRTFSGRSMLPLMRGEPDAERVAFSEATLYGHEELSWRTERWHLILDLDPKRTRPEILIDRAGDPSADVASLHPEVTATLRADLEAFLWQLKKDAERFRDADIENMGPTRVNEYLRSLDSLGYTGRDEEEDD
jgi:arylsulfatase A-like enzyme